MQSVRQVSCQHTTKCILNTNITKNLIDDLFQKLCLLSEKIVVQLHPIFNLESPTFQHFGEGLQILKILPGGRLNAFCNSGSGPPGFFFSNMRENPRTSQDTTPIK